MPGKPLDREKLLKYPLRREEVDGNFFGAMGKLEGPEDLPDPPPHPFPEERRSRAAGGEILPGNAGKEKRQEKNRQTKFRGERISRRGPRIDRLQGVKKEFFRDGVFREVVERGKKRAQHAGFEHQPERGFG